MTAQVLGDMRSDKTVEYIRELEVQVARYRAELQVGAGSWPEGAGMGTRHPLHYAGAQHLASLMQYTTASTSPFPLNQLDHRSQRTIHCALAQSPMIPHLSPFPFPYPRLRSGAARI